MNEKLYEILEKLPRKNLINLMWEALDYMQGFNGRSRTDCITMAMGAEVEETKEGRIKYTIKSLKQVKENTESMGL